MQNCISAELVGKAAEGAEEVGTAMTVARGSTMVVMTWKRGCLLLPVQPKRPQVTGGGKEK
jgi:hypothetical protein